MRGMQEDARWAAPLETLTRPEVRPAEHAEVDAPDPGRTRRSSQYLPFVTRVTAGEPGRSRAACGDAAPDRARLREGDANKV